jgi:hypothetical protein
MRTIFAAAFGLACAVASTASAQRPDRNVEQPIVRSFNWFSYVGGEDIRSACVPGGRNRLRLVYNALWEEQVRVYDIFLQPDGTAGLNIGVLADQGHGGNLSTLLIGEGSDVTGPWRMRKGQRVLGAQETRELLGLLQASTAFGPPRDGLRLPDNDFCGQLRLAGTAFGFQAYTFRQTVSQCEVRRETLRMGQRSSSGQPPA